MYSLEQLQKFLQENGDAVVEALNNKDLSVAGFTSKGIANTGIFENIGDIAITGDITAQGEGKGNIIGNTIEQLLPNKEFPIVPYTLRNLTFTGSYCKALVVNNVLYLIMSFVLSNETAETITAGTCSFDVEVDDETAEKIICVNGETLNDDYSSDANITSITWSKGSGYDVIGSDLIKKVAKNKMRIHCYVASQNADASYPIEGRTFLLLFPRN